MCDEKRATFQKVSMAENGEITEHYSVTLSRIQVWTSVIVGILSIIGMFVGGLMWLQFQAKEMVAQEFTKQLNTFHREAKPAIAEMVEKKIQQHALVASIPFSGRLKTIEERITALEVTMGLVIPDLKHSVDRNSDKLDRVLDRLMEQNK